MRRPIVAAVVAAGALIASHHPALAQFSEPFTIYAPAPAPQAADPLRGTYPYGPRVYGLSYYRYSPQVYGYGVRGYRYAPTAYRYYRAPACEAYVWDRCDEGRRYRRRR